MGRMLSPRIFVLQIVVHSERFLFFKVFLNSRNWLDSFKYYDGWRIWTEDLRAKENTSSLNLIILNPWLEFSIELHVYRKIIYCMYIRYTKIRCFHYILQLFTKKYLILETITRYFNKKRSFIRQEFPFWLYIVGDYYTIPPLYG